MQSAFESASTLWETAAETQLRRPLAARTNSSGRGAIPRGPTDRVDRT